MIGHPVGPGGRDNFFLSVVKTFLRSITKDIATKAWSVVRRYMLLNGDVCVVVEVRSEEFEVKVFMFSSREETERESKEEESKYVVCYCFLCMD